MKIVISILLFTISFLGVSQSKSTNVLRFDEYLGLVKKHHPIVKQAQLVIDQSQAKLLKSRGAFDPKLDVDYDRKVFKNTEYFDKLNATFKIPTWFGIELKANFEENTGTFLNPEATVPEDGLYSAGISMPILRGLLINQRRASLKQAKLYKKQAQLDRDIYVNNILFDASKAYFNWLKTYNEFKLFEAFLENAQQRYRGILRRVEVGENAQIDATEARIALNNRTLSLEQSRIKMIKASLTLSTFLWLQNNIPVELQDTVVPDVDAQPTIDAAFNINQLQSDAITLDAHPKLQSLDYKRQSLNVEKRLKTNMLLPKLDVQYNFLTQTPELGNSFQTSQYKSGVSVSFPLFLRKERGDLKLAKLKLKDNDLELKATRITLQNKINGLKQELSSYQTQTEVTTQMVLDYQELLKAEERKFLLGESSLFLVNSRESKLIQGQLKAIEIQNKFFNTKAKLFNSLAINPEL